MITYKTQPNVKKASTYNSTNNCYQTRYTYFDHSQSNQSKWDNNQKRATRTTSKKEILNKTLTSTATIFKMQSQWKIMKMKMKWEGQNAPIPRAIWWLQMKNRWPTSTTLLHSNKIHHTSDSTKSNGILNNDDAGCSNQIKHVGGSCTTADFISVSGKTWSMSLLSYEKEKIADLVPQLFQLKNSFALMMNSPTQENCTLLLLKIGHLWNWKGGVVGQSSIKRQEINW